MSLRRVISKVFAVREEPICPRCGRRMLRIRRNGFDRVLSIVVPVIRCGCCGRTYLVLRDGRDQ